MYKRGGPNEHWRGWKKIKINKQGEPLFGTQEYLYCNELNLFSALFLF